MIFDRIMLPAQGRNEDYKFAQTGSVRFVAGVGGAGGAEPTPSWLESAIKLDPESGFLSVDDWHVKGELIIEGQVNQWLAQQLVVDDARIQVNRRQDGAVVDSGLVIFDKDTSSEVSSLVYDVAGVWKAGGDRLFTESYNPKLGGYAAGDYPRKAENAVITGKWTFNDFLNGNLGIGITPTERLHVAGNGLFTGGLTAGGNVSAPTFVSGFAGSGWRLEAGAENHLTIDRLTVRGRMDVYELAINQIRGTNGAQWVSDSAKVESVSGNRLTIDTGGDTSFVPFVVNDLLRCQRWNGKNIKYYVVRVTAVGSNYIDVVLVDGSSPREAGDHLVRMGNTEDTDRQGALYLTSSDSNAPYMDVLDGVNSASFAGKTKVRIGRLDGITDPDLGTLSGYGLYTENGYFKGKITVTGGNAATKADVDAVQVGGRNLVEKTNQGITNIAIDSSAGSGTWTTSEEIVDGVRCAKGTKNTTAVETWALFNLRIYTPSKFRANQQYAISFKMKPSFAVSNKTILLSTNTNQALTTNSDTYSLLAGVWNHVKLVVTTLPEFDTILAGRPTVHLRLSIEGNNSTGDTVLLKDIKIEEGNKATDWTPAPEDVQAEINTAKQEALTAAGNAQNTANSLKDFTDTAFRDGIIDRSESVAIEKYKNSLNEAMAKAEASYNKVYTNTYLEGAAKTSLLNAKVNLWGQRDTLLSAINTAISGGTTTPAQKTAVDNAFNTFNNLMTAFQNALEDANKAIQVKLDNISKGYVDDLEIGGTNLLKNTASGVGWSKTDFDAETRTFTRATTQTSESFVALINQTRLENNTTYTLSAWIKSNGQVKDVDFYVYDKPVSKSYSKRNIAVTTDWQFVTLTFTTDSSTDFSESTIRFDNNGSKTAGVNAILYVKEPKLERGNKATDWSPAPEDVPSALEYLATAIQDGSTDIEGGLINTNVLMVKDTNGEVSGGISGLASDNVGFWTGGTYQDAINDNANVIFRKDGSFSLAGGKISGTEEGDVTIDGNLITGVIESQNWDGENGSRLNLMDGSLEFGNTIKVDSFSKEIIVKDGDTQNTGVRIGDFLLSPTTGGAGALDVDLSGSRTVPAFPAYNPQDPPFLLPGDLTYINSSGVIGSSSVTVSTNLTAGNNYTFQTSINARITREYVLDTATDPIGAPSTIINSISRGGVWPRITVSLFSGATKVGERSFSIIEKSDLGVATFSDQTLNINIPFTAASNSLRVEITQSGEVVWKVRYPASQGNLVEFRNAGLIYSELDASSRVRIIPSAAINELSAKGFLSLWGPEKYFRIYDRAGVTNFIEARGVQMFISPNGVHRLRVTDAGIQKSSNSGVSWTSL